MKKRGLIVIVFITILIFWYLFINKTKTSLNEILEENNISLYTMDEYHFQEFIYDFENSIDKSYKSTNKEEVISLYETIKNKELILGKRFSSVEIEFNFNEFVSRSTFMFKGGEIFLSITLYPEMEGEINIYRGKQCKKYNFYFDEKIYKIISQS